MFTYISDAIGKALPAFLFLAVASPPDMHLFRFLNQFVAEVRMCHGYDGFAFLPGRQAFEVYLAVFRNQVMDIGTRIGND